MSDDQKNDKDTGDGTRGVGDRTGRGVGDRTGRGVGDRTGRGVGDRTGRGLDDATPVPPAAPPGSTPDPL